MIADVPASVLYDIPLKKPTNSSAPTQRIGSAQEAQQIAFTIIKADETRSLYYARVKGMLDGNAPFSYDELVRNGQGNRTNLNFREGEAMLSDAEAPYYDLFAESPTYAQIETDEIDPDKRAQYSRIITEYFDEMVKKWAGFDWNMQRAFHDFVGMGRGFVMWEDPISWQFCAIQDSRVKVPDGTPSDMDALEILVVRQSMTVSQLFGKIYDEKVAAKAGWNVPAVIDAIWGAKPERTTDGPTPNYEMYQQQIRNHDLYQTIRSDVIRVVNIFVREFSGKVSHYIVEEAGGVAAPPQAPTSNQKPKPVRYLYKKMNRYGCFRAVLGSLFFDIGDGTWHSIKGLGVKQYPFIEIKNRLNCSIIDNAFINLSILAQPKASLVEGETALMQLGPLTILPASLELRQWGLQGRMEEALVTEQALTVKLENNTGQYRRPMTRKSGNPDTATKVQYDALSGASLQKGPINRFFSQLDHIFEQMYIRATNFNLQPENNGVGPNCLALDFQQKCLDAGVPKKCLKKYRFVRASRTSGNGSVFLRQQVVNQTGSLVPLMPEAGRQAWLDDAISVLAGAENVARWNPKQRLNPTLENDTAFALLENDSLREGSPVLVTSTQNNFIHATVHLRASSDAINSIPQGGDPMRVLAFLEQAGPHIAIHLQGMANDPMRGQEAKVLVGQFKQMSAITDQLRRQIERQQQAQAAEMQRRQMEMQAQMEKTQQVMTDEQLAQLETQNKIQLSREKANTSMELRSQRHIQDLTIKRQKADQDLAISDATTAADIRSKTAKTAADIASKGAKSE